MRILTRQDGVAIPLVIAVLFMVTGLIAIIATASTGMFDRSQDRIDAVTGRNPADEGVRAYITALTDNHAGEENGFVFDLPALKGFEVNGARVVSNASLGAGFNQVDASVPANARYALEIPPANGVKAPTRYWQMMALIPPTYLANEGAKLIAYFRGWTVPRGGGQATTPEIIRVELRPSIFSDYQIISDGPMQFIDGAHIQAKLHSNGYADTRLGIVDTGGHQINTAAATCHPGSDHSTTSGSIRACGGASSVHENSGQLISMLRAKDAAKRIEAACGSGAKVPATCYRRRDPNDPRPYIVRLGPSGITVQGQDSGPSTISAKMAALPAYGGGAAVLFDRSVHMLRPAGAGSSSGGALAADHRLTIAAFDPFDGGERGTNAASITVFESMGHTMAASSASRPASLGLIAQSDVIFNISPNNPYGKRCPSTMRAAVAAGSGGVVMTPEELVVGAPPSGTPPSCPGGFTFEGSAAGHFSPLVKLTWETCIGGNCSDKTIGYRGARIYRYSPQLRDNPPPYFPIAGDWQIYKYNDANLDCFNASGQLQKSLAGCA